METLLDTPPFPEHTSGHSTQSGATAEILTFLFGHVPFTDRTHEGRVDANLPANVFKARHFANFYEAAAEAANSRLYGGIHYTRGNQVGLEQGYHIGRLVNKLQIYCGE
ncbi:MAG: phosphatase PAP2 family protein [Saprospiraceae bacterium]|nr:phosphatase PAP2 family protein [Saprospiraceae bacterium]